MVELTQTVPSKLLDMYVVSQGITKVLFLVCCDSFMILILIYLCYSPIMFFLVYFYFEKYLLYSKEICIIIDIYIYKLF